MTMSKTKSMYDLCVTLRAHDQDIRLLTKYLRELSVGSEYSVLPTLNKINIKLPIPNGTATGYRATVTQLSKYSRHRNTVKGNAVALKSAIRSAEPYLSPNDHKLLSEYLNCYCRVQRRIEDFWIKFKCTNEEMT